MPPSNVVIVGPSGSAPNKVQFANAALRHLQQHNVQATNVTFLVDGAENRQHLLDHGIPPQNIRNVSGNNVHTALNSLAPSTGSVPENQRIQNVYLFGHGHISNPVTMQENDAAGLRASDIPNMRRDLFTPNTKWEIHSCNSGARNLLEAAAASMNAIDNYNYTQTMNIDSSSIAQKISDHCRCTVNAWDGRTSYRLINRGLGPIGPSQFRDANGKYSISEILNRAATGNFHDAEFREFKPRGSQDNIGGIQFQLGNPISAFQNVRNVKGLVLDRKKQLAFLINETSTQDTLPPISLPDLAASLLVVFETAFNPSFSLDPEDPKNPNGPNLKKVFYPETLRETQVGEIMFEADWFLKKLCYGIDQVGSNINGYINLAERRLNSNNISGEEWSRLWIVCKKLATQASPDMLWVDDIQLEVKVARMVVDSNSATGLKDEGTISVELQQFVQHINSVMPTLISRYPILHQLQQVYKTFVVAQYLLDSGVEIDLAEVRRIYAQHKEDMARKQIKDLVPAFSKEYSKTSGNAVHTLKVHGGIDFTSKPKEYVQVPIVHSLQVAFTDAMANNAMVEIPYAMKGYDLVPLTTLARVSYCAEADCPMQIEWRPDSLKICGESYCWDHYTAKFPSCNSCKSPILDHVATVSNKPYHPGCLLCCECKIQLQKSIVSDKSQNLFCSTACANKRHAQQFQDSLSFSQKLKVVNENKTQEEIELEKAVALSLLLSVNQVPSRVNEEDEELNRAIAASMQDSEKNLNTDDEMERAIAASLVESAKAKRMQAKDEVMNKAIQASLEEIPQEDIELQRALLEQNVVIQSPFEQQHVAVPSFLPEYVDFESLDHSDEQEDLELLLAIQASLS